jgi:NADH:ubiquinone oxidoreductase subunit F (NADH-binding)
MRTTARPNRRLASILGPQGMPRLLSGLEETTGPVALDEHLDRWGVLDLSAGRALIDQVEASGLVGHGGAWFPVAAKWRAVGRRGRRPVVVANGAEGEPASAKDSLLLSRAPHLVLDGASAAAAALGATRAVVYTAAHHAGVVWAAVEERRRAGLDPVEVEVVVSPDAFLAGQETAVVGVLNGRPVPAPLFSAVQTIRERGVAGRPTLVQNVETLAHVALIARFGAEWFRSVGDREWPGSMLLTVTGRWPEPVVVEAPLASPLHDAVGLRPADAAHFQAALLGGYGGTWVSMETLFGLRLTEAAARRAHATLGAGVVALLPRQACPVTEVARVVGYMRAQGAGQCGPCVLGLGELAGQLDALAHRGPKGGRPRRVEELMEVCGLMEGRGACRHPDGVARFVRSACAVFAADFGAHLRGAPCPYSGGPGALPTPLPNHRRSAVTPGGRR